jgi:hypothetical protein
VIEGQGLARTPVLELSLFSPALPFTPQSPIPMTEIATAAAPELVACQHCGHLDSGTFCSGCGKQLADDPSRTVAHDIWEMLVVDRLNDAREYATSSFYLVVRPLRFFRTVLDRPAMRASHVFPEPVPQALPRGRVQPPVTFFVLSFVTSILVGKITGVQATDQWIKGIDQDFNDELSLVAMIVLLGIYGTLFRYTAGKRISTEEAAILSGYTVGGSAGISAILSMVPSGDTIGGLLVLYLMLVVPQIVLPRLYRISRPRVLVAQVGAAFGAVIILAMMVGLITNVVNGIA